MQNVSLFVYVVVVVVLTVVVVVATYRQYSLKSLIFKRFNGQMVTLGIVVFQ